MHDHKKGSTTERGVFFLDEKEEETMAFIDVRLIIDDMFVAFVISSAMAFIDLIGLMIKGK